MQLMCEAQWLGSACELHRPIWMRFLRDADSSRGGCWCQGGLREVTLDTHDMIIRSHVYARYNPTASCRWVTVV